VGHSVRSTPKRRASGSIRLGVAGLRMLGSSCSARPVLGTDGRRGHRLAPLGIICQPLRAHWEQQSRRALPQQLQGMRGPKDGTVASSGHSFILTARSWPQCWQVTNEPRTPCQRMLPSVIGRIGSSSQTAPKAAYDCGVSEGSHSIFPSQPEARIPAPPGAHLALLGQMRKTLLPGPISEGPGPRGTDAR
jgi:hypothetical protein